MARIRTIKPEFPQSESMGRVSRDARLLFIMLWTIADDVGRLRGNSRMLASLLYPYDEDAGRLIEGWLCELASEGCIDRYQVAGDSYVSIRNWLNHQRIDKPSKSKIPAFDESSRIPANPREPSCEDQRKGSEEGKGREGKGEQHAPPDAVAASLTNLFTFLFCPNTGKQHAPPDAVAASLTNLFTFLFCPNTGKQHAPPDAVAASLTNLFTFLFCPNTGKPKANKPTEKSTLSLNDIAATGIDRQVATDFLTLRKAKRAPLTKSAFDGLVTAWAKAGLKPEAGMRVCVARGWQGFDPAWVKPQQTGRHDLSAMDYNKGATPDGRF